MKKIIIALFSCLVLVHIPTTVFAEKKIYVESQTTSDPSPVTAITTIRETWTLCPTLLRAGTSFIHTNTTMISCRPIPIRSLPRMTCPRILRACACHTGFPRGRKTRITRCSAQYMTDLAV